VNKNKSVNYMWIIFGDYRRLKEMGQSRPKPALPPGADESVQVLEYVHSLQIVRKQIERPQPAGAAQLLG